MRRLVALPLGFLGAAAIAARAYHRGSLTASGAVAATGVGALIMSTGGTAAAGLLSFFFTSTALSRYRLSDKQGVAADKFHKGDRRDAAQVLANGGPAAVFSTLGLVLGSARLHVAALGALAAANADTWATEIGLLSRGRPRMILSLRKVDKGTSGAVSLAGLAGMTAGAALLALVARGRGPAAPIPVFVGGMVGALTDSVLGALLQERRTCTRCGAATEQQRHRCGGETHITGGVPGLDNDAVNALSGLIAGLVGLMIASEDNRGA